MTITEIVKDPEWQQLRGSLVNTWKQKAERNCQLLRTYLDDFKDPLKNRRVLNYLTGTAFRIGRIQHPDIDKLINEIKCQRSMI